MENEKSLGYKQQFFLPDTRFPVAVRQTVHEEVSAWLGFDWMA